MGTFWKPELGLKNSDGWSFELKADIPWAGSVMRKYVATRKIANAEELQTELAPLEVESGAISEELASLNAELKSDAYKGRMKDADLAANKKAMQTRVAELREINSILKDRIRDLREALAPHGKEYWLDSVTDILKCVGGTGDGLLSWAVERTQMDVLAQKLPSENYEGHKAWLRFFAANHKRDPRRIRIA